MHRGSLLVALLATAGCGTGAEPMSVPPTLLAVVPAQTIVQERTPHAIRGRVIAAQFIFINLVGLVPMLAISGMADLIGIPKVMLGLAALTLASSLLSFRLRRTLQGA